MSHDDQHRRRFPPGQVRTTRSGTYFVKEIAAKNTEEAEERARGFFSATLDNFAARRGITKDAAAEAMIDASNKLRAFFNDEIVPSLTNSLAALTLGVAFNDALRDMEAFVGNEDPEEGRIFVSDMIRTAIYLSEHIQKKGG